MGRASGRGWGCPPWVPGTVRHRGQEQIQGDCVHINSAFGQPGGIGHLALGLGWKEGPGWMSRSRLQGQPTGRREQTELALVLFSWLAGVLCLLQFPKMPTDAWHS